LDEPNHTKQQKNKIKYKKKIKNKKIKKTISKKEPILTSNVPLPSLHDRKTDPKTKRKKNKKGIKQKNKT